MPCERWPPGMRQVCYDDWFPSAPCLASTTVEFRRCSDCPIRQVGKSIGRAIGVLKSPFLHSSASLLDRILWQWCKLVWEKGARDCHSPGVRNNNHTTANTASPHGITWQPLLQQARLDVLDSGALTRYAHGLTRFVRLLKVGSARQSAEGMQ